MNARSDSSEWMCSLTVLNGCTLWLLSIGLPVHMITTASQSTHTGTPTNVLLIVYTWLTTHITTTPEYLDIEMCCELISYEFHFF